MTENPYESPGEGTVSASRKTYKPRAYDYGTLSLLLMFVGGIIFFPSLLVMLGEPLWGLVGAVPGGLFLAVGWGIGRYKIWAWYGGVLLLMPFSLLLLGVVLYAGASGSVGLMTLVIPAFCLYTVWVLLSKGGREHFRQTAEAIARAKANPDSIAGRAYRRR